jgi:hypothetical protein
MENLILRNVSVLLALVPAACGGVADSSQESQEPGTVVIVPSIPMTASSPPSASPEGGAAGAQGASPASLKAACTRFGQLDVSGGDPDCSGKMCGEPCTLLDASGRPLLVRGHTFLCNTRERCVDYPNE